GHGEPDQGAAVGPVRRARELRDDAGQPGAAVPGDGGVPGAAVPAAVRVGADGGGGGGGRGAAAEGAGAGGGGGGERAARVGGARRLRALAVAPGPAASG